jgi:hypothetical protein
MSWQARMCLGILQGVQQRQNALTRIARLRRVFHDFVEVLGEGTVRQVQLPPLSMRLMHTSGGSSPPHRRHSSSLGPQVGRHYGVAQRVLQAM